MSLFRFGSALGIVLGVTLTLAGFIAWTTDIGEHLVHVLASLFRGYGPGPVAALIGGVWGGAIGFTFGVSTAWLYNRLAPTTAAGKDL